MPALHPFIEAHLWIMCFLGPPAWLLFGYHYAIAFLLGTMLCLPAFAAAAFLYRGYYRIVCLIAGVLIWIGFGCTACSIIV